MAKPEETPKDQGITQTSESTGTASKTGKTVTSLATEVTGNDDLESQKELFEEAINETKKIQDAQKITSAGELNKQLSSVTADTQVQAAALSAISSLPFDKLIGEPLNAAIKAQSAAAKSTLQYIQSVGLKGDKVVMVNFEFVNGGVMKKFQIPLLTLVPIPSFSIKALDYEFKVKVDASSSAQASTSESLNNMWNVGYNSNTSSKIDIPSTEKKDGDASKKEDKAATEKSANDKASEAKAKIDEAQKEANDKEQAKKAKEAQDASNAAVAAATAKPSGLSMNTTISTKKDSSATRDSKYSVEATMDVRIHAGQEDMPSGVLTLLEVLNASRNTFDPDGELTIAPSTTVTLGSDGKVSVIVNYINKEGLYAPSCITCSDGGEVIILNKTSAKVTFKNKGVYVVSAETQNVTVVVNPQPTTEVLITDDKKAGSAA